MTGSAPVDEAIELLQQLGLKEYEARCFVGLTRLDTGTARQLSDLTEVPRTRVYDAIRVLEAQGLVEVHHSSPQRFRAVSLAEATRTLRDQYESRVERLQDALETVDPVEETDNEPIQEVWALAGQSAIETRAEDLITSATDEVVLVVGDESLMTADLVATLTGLGSEVELLIGAVSEPVAADLREAVPNATTFISGLGWLHGDDGGGKAAVGRLLLVDRSTILVSTIVPDTGDEQAVFGGGFGNGLVVIARRIMAHGLLPTRDPA